MELGCLGLGTMDKAIAINSLHHGFKITPLNKAIFRVKYTSPNRRNLLHTNLYTAHRHTCSCFMNLGALQETVQPTRSMLLPLEIHNLLTGSPTEWSQSTMLLLDLDPSTAKLAIGFIGPFLSVFGFLFILRIVMSWYPKLPVNKFPYVLAYAPTEPILIPTRKLIPPLGGVDVTPVVWFGLISFLNEILVGPQGLLVLLSQQAN